MTQSNDLFDQRSQPNEPATTGKRARNAQRSRAGKSLPTDRMKFEAQLKCLNKYGSLSGPGKKAVTAEDVSRAMEKAISHYTAPLSNGFFVDAGWLEKRGKGEYAASDALVEYGRRLATNREDVARAVQPLRETASGAWFWQTIKSQLDFSNTADESDLLYVLMSEADASSDHLPQLRNLLEWVEYIGMIRRTDGVVRSVGKDSLVDSDKRPADVAQQEKHEAGEPEAGGEPTKGAGAEESPTPTAGPALPALTQPNRELAPAVVTFEVSVRVTADDLAKLSPEQIQTLFAAVGTVMSASSSTRT